MKFISIFQKSPKRVNTGLCFGNFDDKRKFTIEEMKYLIEKYQLIESFKEKISKEVSLKFQS